MHNNYSSIAFYNWTLQYLTLMGTASFPQEYKFVLLQSKKVIEQSDFVKYIVLYGSLGWVIVIYGITIVMKLCFGFLGFTNCPSNFAITMLDEQSSFVFKIINLSYWSQLTSIRDEHCFPSNLMCARLFALIRSSFKRDWVAQQWMYILNVKMKCGQSNFSKHEKEAVDRVAGS